MNGFKCVHCGATSYNTHDLENHYCGRCHHFCDEVEKMSNMDGAPGPSYESIMDEARSLDAVTQMLEHMDSALGTAFAEARRQFQADTMMVPVLIAHLVRLVNEDKIDDAIAMLNEAIQKHSDGPLLVFNLAVTMHNAICKSFDMEPKDLADGWEAEWRGLAELRAIGVFLQDHQYLEAFGVWNELDGSTMGVILVELAVLSAKAYEAVTGLRPDHGHDTHVVFHKVSLN